MKDLTPDHWKKLDTILEAVLERDPDDRYSYLEQICGSDTSLYNSIDTLLRLHNDAEKILGDSAATYAAPLIPGLLEEFDRSRDQDLPQGSMLGPYRIISVAGRGGMGTVYRAARADDTYSKEVAIKLVRRGMDTVDILRRFRHEQQILASLDHPDIARLYDAGASEDGRPYFVMEFVDGVPIDQYCHDLKLSVRQRVELFLSVCRAVSYAHQKLIVHRDLKPSNILVTPDGKIKLLDFGVAKLMDDEDDNPGVPHTRTGNRLLTPLYAAPEQLMDAQISTATDVFTLGVVLYEILTGCRPFNRQKHVVMASSMATDITLPSKITQSESLRRTLRGDLDNILVKALRNEPEFRYPSPEQFAEDLKKYLENMPVSARPYETGYRIRKFVGRHKAGVAASAFAILLLVMFMLGLIFLQAETARERDIANLERNKANEVAAFLEELLSSANPHYGTSRADTLRLRDFVQLSTGKVRIDLANQPVVKARMLNVLGHMHGKLNMLDEAKTLLEEALELRLTMHGDDHPDVAESLNDLGTIYHKMGDYDEAEELIRSGLDLRISYGRNDDLAGSFTTLANLLNDKGDYDQAEGFYREALDIREQLYGPGHEKTAVSLLNLATILQRKGNLDQAEIFHLRTLAVNREFLGPGHPLVAGSENNLGLLYASRGQNEQAESLLRSAMTTRKKIFGEEHPNVITSTNNLASVLNDLGRYDEAEHFFRLSLDLRRKVHGENSIQTAVGLNNLASLLRRTGRLDEAIILTREAVDLAGTINGPDHPQVGILSGNLASMIRSNGDAFESEQIYRSSLSVLAKTLSPDHPSIARQQIGLAECLSDQNRLDEAIELMLAGYGVLIEKGIDASATRANLARLYEAAGNSSEAEKYRHDTVP